MNSFVGWKGWQNNSSMCWWPWVPPLHGHQGSSSTPPCWDSPLLRGLYPWKHAPTLDISWYSCSLIYTCLDRGYAEEFVERWRVKKKNRKMYSSILHTHTHTHSHTKYFFSPNPGSKHNLSFTSLSALFLSIFIEVCLAFPWLVLIDRQKEWEQIRCCGRLSACWGCRWSHQVLNVSVLCCLQIILKL